MRGEGRKWRGKQERKEEKRTNKKREGEGRKRRVKQESKGEGRTNKKGEGIQKGREGKGKGVDRGWGVLSSGNRSIDTVINDCHSSLQGENAKGPIYSWVSQGVGRREDESVGG